MVQRHCEKGSDVTLGSRIFTDRVVKHCNRVLKKMVNATSLSVLNRHLDDAIGNVNFW